MCKVKKADPVEEESTIVVTREQERWGAERMVNKHRAATGEEG